MDLARIIFDLDGTLVDSLAGIEYSLERVTGLNRSSDRGYTPQNSGEEIAQVVDDLVAPFRESYDMEGCNETVLMRWAHATAYGRLPRMAPRSRYLLGALDELGSVFARVGGTA